MSDAWFGGRLLLTRAWLVAHRAVPAGWIAVLAGALFALWGGISVQVWGAQREVPLWALAPGTLAMIAGTAFDDQVAGPPPARPGWLRRARVFWVCALVAGATLVAVPTAAALGDPAIAGVTGLLVALSFLPAVLDPRAGPVLGATVDVLALVYGGKVAADRGMSDVVASVPGVLWPVLGLAVLVGVLVYVGGRPAPHEWRSHD
jgi:hypothetical protein